MAGKFLNKTKVELLIYKTIKEKNTNTIESILIICKEYDIEFDEIEKLLPQHIKNKLEEEAKSLNLLTKTDEVPNTSQTNTNEIQKLKG